MENKKCNLPTPNSNSSYRLMLHGELKIRACPTPAVNMILVVPPQFLLDRDIGDSVKFMYCWLYTHTYPQVPYMMGHSMSPVFVYPIIPIDIVLANIHAHICILHEYMGNWVLYPKPWRFTTQPVHLWQSNLAVRNKILANGPSLFNPIPGILDIFVTFCGHTTMGAFDIRIWLKRSLFPKSSTFIGLILGVCLKLVYIAIMMLTHPHIYPPVN
jgi:hypothetical protein